MKYGMVCFCVAWCRDDGMRVSMKRKRAVFYSHEEKDWSIIESADMTLFENSKENQEVHLDQEEKQFQELWKDYFKNIAIEERKNPRLQKQFMQKRYWKYLTEKE